MVSVTTLPQAKKPVSAAALKDAAAADSGSNWSRRKVESRRKLLAAARKLFAERGYHEIRTQDISKEAGVGYGTFYLQFEDKLDCFLSVAEQASRELYDIVRPQLDAATSFADHIRIMLNASFNYSLENPGVLRAIVADARILSKDKIGPFARSIAELTTMVDGWKHKGEISPNIDSALVTLLILGAAKQGDAVIKSYARDKSAIIDNITAFLVQGLEVRDDASQKTHAVSSQSVAAFEPVIHKNPEEKVDSRDKLLAAARILFAENGYDSVKPKEITTLAGVGVGTFYSYFEDKLDCFLAVTNEAADELAEMGKKYTASATAFPEMLRQLLKASFDYSAANPGMYRAIVEDVRVLTKHKKRPVRRGLDALLVTLESGKKSGDVESIFSSKLLAFLIAGAVSQSDEYIGRNPERRDATIESIISFIHNAISAR